MRPSPLLLLLLLLCSTTAAADPVDQQIHLALGGDEWSRVVTWVSQGSAPTTSLVNYRLIGSRDSKTAAGYWTAFSPVVNRTIFVHRAFMRDLMLGSVYGTLSACLTLMDTSSDCCRVLRQQHWTHE